MLVRSERLTRADLAIWNEQYRADLLNGRKLDRKIEIAQGAVRSFLDGGPAYLGVSWGKDSLCMLDIVCRAGIRLPVVWMRYGEATNPGCYVVRDEYLAKHPLSDYREIDVGEAISARDDYSLACESTGTNRYVCGVRLEESRVRRISVLTHGVETGVSCRPLAYWKGEEVFAYLARFGLPTHEAYAMNGGGRYDRKHLRVASIGGPQGTHFGRAQWEKEYYMDVWNRQLLRVRDEAVR